MEKRLEGGVHASLRRRLGLSLGRSGGRCSRGLGGGARCL